MRGYLSPANSPCFSPHAVEAKAECATNTAPQRKRASDTLLGRLADLARRTKVSQMRKCDVPSLPAASGRVRFRPDALRQCVLMSHHPNSPGGNRWRRSWRYKTAYIQVRRRTARGRPSMSPTSVARLWRDARGMRSTHGKQLLCRCVHGSAEPVTVLRNVQAVLESWMMLCRGWETLACNYASESRDGRR